MFNFFKSKKTEDMSKIILLLEKIFIQIDEPLFLKEIQDGVISNIKLGFNGNFDIFFTKKAASYEMQSPKINVLFQQIKVQDTKGSFSDVEITIIDNLIAGLKFSNSDFDYYNVISIDTTSVKKVLNQLENQYLAEKLTAFGFDIADIPAYEIYEVAIDDKTYIHLKDVFDGDFIGLWNNKLYWLKHEENQALLIPKKCYDFFRKEIFQATNDEIHQVLIDLL